MEKVERQKALSGSLADVVSVLESNTEELSRALNQFRVDEKGQTAQIENEGGIP